MRVKAQVDTESQAGGPFTKGRPIVVTDASNRSSKRGRPKGNRSDVVVSNAANTSLAQGCEDLNKATPTCGTGSVIASTATDSAFTAGSAIPTTLFGQGGYISLITKAGLSADTASPSISTDAALSMAVLKTTNRPHPSVCARRHS